MRKKLHGDMTSVLRIAVTCWLVSAGWLLAFLPVAGRANPTNEHTREIVEDSQLRFRLKLLNLRSMRTSELRIELSLVCSDRRCPWSQLVLNLTRSVGLYAWSEEAWPKEAESALCQFSGTAYIADGPTPGRSGDDHEAANSSYATLNLCRGPSGLIAVNSMPFLVSSSPAAANETPLNISYSWLASGDRSRGRTTDRLRAAFERSSEVLLTRISVNQTGDKGAFRVPGCAAKESRSYDNTFINTDSDQAASRIRYRRSAHSPSIVEASGAAFAESVSHRFVEILFVVDSSITSFQGHILDDFVFGILGIAQGVFRDPTLEEDIELSLASIYRLSPQEEAVFFSNSNATEYAAKKVLDTLNEWSHYLRHTEFSKHHSWDISVLLTRKVIVDFARDENHKVFSFPVLGITTFASICALGRNGIVVHEAGLQSGFTLAHELGHAFNMPHDDTPYCARHSVDTGVSFIMTSSLHPSTYPWRWSACSKLELRRFLHSSLSDCTKERSEPLVLQQKMKRSAESRYYPQFTVDEQCKMILGSGASMCYMSDKLCDLLWCRLNNETAFCYSKRVVWAPRTPCRPNSICLDGECVPEILSHIDGGWGQWGEWTNCSAECGGGVRWRRRMCDNPRPRKGGAFCPGHRALVRTCGLQLCKDGTTARDAQCAEHAKRRDPMLNAVALLPGLSSESRCSLLTCDLLTGGRFAIDSVLDGTPCHPFDYGICINRVCKPAGCDGVLNSNLRWDRCGVCGGRNDSCRLLDNTISVEILPGAPYIHTFTQGSSNIEVTTVDGTGHLCTIEILSLNGSDTMTHSVNPTQRNVRAHSMALLSSSALSPMTDAKQQQEVQRMVSNQFALLADRGKRSTFDISKKTEVYVSGVWIQLSEPDPSIGIPDWRLNIIGRLTSELSIRLATKINESWEPRAAQKVSLRMRVHVPNLQISIAPVGSCSHRCQGIQTFERVCEEVGAGEGLTRRLSMSVCLASSPPIFIPPLPPALTCNIHCRYQWHVVPGNCSSRCGSGSAIDTYDCVLKRDGSEHHESVEPDWTNCEPRSSRLARRDCNGDCSPVEWRFGAWSACSATCGLDGVRSRTVVCVDSRGFEWPSVECESLTLPGILFEPCESPQACHTWRSGSWSPCNTYCGQGLQRRSVFCAWNNNVSETAPSAMCPADKIPVSEKNCTGMCHGTWQAGKWSECHSPCQIGRMLRQVTCVIGQKKVNILNCPLASKPTDSMDCSHQCDIHWSYSNWGPCSVTCGDTGRQKRLAFCVNSTNRVIASEDCIKRIGPMEVVQPCKRWVKCLKALENKFIWRVSEWSSCSQSCGRGGMRQRRVDCISIETNEESGDKTGHAIVDANKCDIFVRPKPNQPCSRHIDCPYWKFTPWSNCSAVCGHGWQFRSALCMWRLSNVSVVVVPPTYCDRGGLQNIQSLLRQTCFQKQCPHWRAEDWTECMADCDDEGIKVREVNCIQDGQIVDQKLCSAEIRPIESQECNSTVRCQPSWSPGSWSECSQICGNQLGVQVRSITCQDRYGRNALGCQSQEKPSDTRECRMMTPCPQWRTSNWSTCAGICGNGTRTRQLSCQWMNGTPAADGLCSGDPATSPRPSISENCRLEVVCRWRVGPWSVCTAPCALLYSRDRPYSLHGQKHRTVECRLDVNGPVLPESLCVQRRPRPPGNRRCRRVDDEILRACRQSKFGVSGDPGRSATNRREAPNTQQESLMLWSSGPWSSCSARCGRGQQIRKVMPCSPSSPTAFLQSCIRKRPRTRRGCFVAFCPYAWIAGPWSSCSTTCGRGKVSRRVECQRVSPEGWHLGEATVASLCEPSAAPEAVRACNLRECGGSGGAFWDVGEFGECHYDSGGVYDDETEGGGSGRNGCGEGERRRSVECRTSKASTDPTDAVCPHGGAPPERDICPPRRCMAESCAQLKRLTRIKMDGEYGIMIQGQTVTVYCHRMLSRHPREYISLPPGSYKNNIAMMHHIALPLGVNNQPVFQHCPNSTERTLFNFHTCKRPGAPCRVVQDTESFVTGISVFRKYRLLLTPRLMINGSDGTFANTWKRFIPVGQAGDCFSIMRNCAIAKFSIDLSGSSFVIDSENKWITVNLKTKHFGQLGGQQVQGMCGGSCGFCKLPDNMLLVKLATSVPLA